MSGASPAPSTATSSARSARQTSAPRSSSPSRRRAKAPRPSGSVSRKARPRRRSNPAGSRSGCAERRRAGEAKALPRARTGAGRAPVSFEASTPRTTLRGLSRRASRAKPRWRLSAMTPALTGTRRRLVVCRARVRVSMAVTGRPMDRGACRLGRSRDEQNDEPAAVRARRSRSCSIDLRWRRLQRFRRGLHCHRPSPRRSPDRSAAPARRAALLRPGRDRAAQHRLEYAAGSPADDGSPRRPRLPRGSDRPRAAGAAARWLCGGVRLPRLCRRHRLRVFPVDAEPPTSSAGSPRRPRSGRTSTTPASRTGNAPVRTGQPRRSNGQPDPAVPLPRRRARPCSPSCRRSA